MKIDDDKITRAINSKMPNGPGECTVCSENSWTYDSTLFEVREYQGGGMVIGGRSSILPTIALTCSNCGNTQFLNAVTLGLVDKEGKIVEASGS